MSVPLAPLAFTSLPSISRAACWPTRKALNAELRSASSTRLGSASVIGLPKMPRLRPSMLWTTSVGEPRSRATAWNSDSTAAGSLPSQAYRRTPWDFSSFRSTALSGSLAATATRMPFSANSFAQLELMPGPPPTMRATSWATAGGTLLSVWLMSSSPCVFLSVASASFRGRRACRISPLGNSGRQVRMRGDAERLHRDRPGRHVFPFHFAHGSLLKGSGISRAWREDAGSGRCPSRSSSPT